VIAIQVPGFQQGASPKGLQLLMTLTASGGSIAGIVQESATGHVTVVARAPPIGRTTTEGWNDGRRKIGSPIIDRVLLELRLNCSRLNWQSHYNSSALVEWT
jgi:hypothetical protein